MKLNLENRLAFVSGSAKGIGLAVATALLQEGARVIINGRKNSAEKAAELSSYGSCIGIDGCRCKQPNGSVP